MHIPSPHVVKEHYHACDIHDRSATLKVICCTWRSRDNRRYSALADHNLYCHNSGANWRYTITFCIAIDVLRSIGLLSKIMLYLLSFPILNIIVSCNFRI